MVTSSALAVAAREVADHQQRQRRDAEDLKQHRVEQEAGAEADDGTDHRAAEQPERDDHDRDEVGRGPEQREVGEERDLEDHRDERRSGRSAARSAG